LTEILLGADENGLVLRDGHLAGAPEEGSLAAVRLDGAIVSTVDRSESQTLTVTL
jgi:hypothetical protein